MRSVADAEPSAGWAEIALAALVYCGAFAVLRLLVSPTIGVDDVEQVIVTQELRWGYIARQPPLYSWWLGLWAALLGPGLKALVAAKYTMLFGAVVFFHRSAALLLARRWMPLLATGSLALFFLLGYQANIGFTHTAALLFVTSFAMWSLLELGRRPTAWRYALLGAALGLGLLSKYNFAGAFLAMIAAGLCDRGLRAVLLDRRALLALAMAALIFLPYGIWLLAHRDELSGLVGAYVQGGEAASPLARRLGALGKLAKAFVEAVFPYLVLAPALYWAAFGRRGWRVALAASPAARFTLAHAGIALAVTVLLAGGAGTPFIERYMVPYVLFLPITVLAVVEAKQQAFAVSPFWVARRMRWTAGLIAVVIVAAAGGVAGYALRTPPNCGHCRLQKPFDGLADQLAAQLAGGGPATLIAGDEFIGGNLIPRLGLRTYSPAYPGYAPGAAARGDGGCLVVWDGGLDEAGLGRLRDFVRRIRGEDWPEAAPVRTIAVPYARRPEIEHRWHAAVLPAAGDCR